VGIPTETVKAWAAAADCAAPAKAAINAELRRGGKGGRTANVRPPTVRGMVGGDVAVSVLVPVRVISTPNARDHWRTRAKLARHQRNIVGMFLSRIVLPAPPVVVTLTRVYAAAKGQRPFDDDNAVAAMKNVRDEVASLYGLDDADGSGLQWAYGPQEAGDAAGVRIEVKAVRT
jgi:hypothetical protein